MATLAVARHNPDHPEHQRVLFRRRIEAVMLGAITEILMAAGFGFTFLTASGERTALLLVHSRSTPGIY